MAARSLSPDLAIRHHSATMTLALYRARQAVKDAIRRKGEKVSAYPSCDITTMAKAYLAEHRELSRNQSLLLCRCHGQRQSRP